MLRRRSWLLLALLLPVPARAFEIADDWAGPVCAFLPCTTMGGGVDGLHAYLTAKVLVAMEIGFVAVALLALFLSAMKMVLFSEQEDVVKSSRTQFVYGIAACAVVSFARWLTQAFAPQFVGADLVDHAIVNSVIGNVTALIRICLALLVIVNIVIQGMRLVTSRGEQDQFEKARKRLFATFIGAGFVMLANVVVVSLLPGTQGNTTMATEFAGIARYLITIVAFGAVIVIIAAGAALMLSVDEGLKDKAKTMIKSAIVALAAVIVSYALVFSFITLSS